MKYEFFDVTADIGIRAWGESLNTAFENAATALFEVITNTSQIKPLLCHSIIIESEDDKALLYDWLSELIFIHDTEYLVFSKFEVNITQKAEDKYLLKAKAWGEELQKEVHEIRDEVKAITFHMMKIQKEKGYKLQVIVDV